MTLLYILGEAFFFHLPFLEVDAYRKLDKPDIVTGIQELEAAFQFQMRLIDSYGPWVFVKTLRYRFPLLTF
jgi:hypothetical protein